MEKPFAFCALKYLLLWEQKERDIYTPMSGNASPDDLRKAMSHFRVARNFKGLGEEDYAKRILLAVRKAGEASSSTPAEKVNQLVLTFPSLQDGSTKKSNLSAATKLLWLTYRRPYVIYDARAVTALKKIGAQFADRNYAEYASAWQAAYKKRKSEITAAAAQLPALLPYFSAWHNSAASIEKLVLKPWFLERIFDIYLWELGGAEKTPT